VLEYGKRSLDIAHRAGVRIGYGSELLGGLEEEQTREFQLVGGEIVR
jgi:hypothetical protein